MESKELINQIVQQGGRILLVGGGLRKLPSQYQRHPKLEIWDDEVEAIQNLSIPSTVKVIMWNRYISHKTMGKLNNAVAGLHAFKFPMLKTREIKDLLSCLIPVDIDETITVNDKPLHTELIPLTPIEPEVSDEVTTEVKESAIMAQRKILAPGVLKKFIAKNISLTVDYSKRGSIAKEGQRLYTKAVAEGVKTTEGSVIQAVSATIKEMKKNKGVAPSPSKEVIKPLKLSQTDDFDELDKLLVDAVAAMKLIQEHMPKVKKEVEKLRAIREKMIKLLE